MADWDVVDSAPSVASPEKTGEWDAVKTESPSLVARAIEPIKNVPTEIGKEFSEGAQKLRDIDSRYDDALKTGRPPIGSSLKSISGAAQMLFSPITGTAKAIVGKPVGNVTRDVTGNETAGQFMENLGTDVGSLVGPGALSKAGSKIADALPKYSQSVEKLVREGVQLTLGQIYQGALKGIEDWAQKMPGVSRLVKNGQLASIESFNRVMLDKALEPVGARLPKGLSGRDAIAWTEEKIGSQYDKLLPKLTFQVDAEFLNDTASIRSKAMTLPQERQKQLAAIGDDLTARLNASGGMSGRLYKTIDSELSAKARDYLRSGDVDQRGLGLLISDLRGAMMDALERSNPKFTDQLRDVNSAWASFMRLADASALRAKSGGVFSPNDLLTSIKRGSTKGAFRRGDALFQDIAEAAAEVLPSNVPEGLGLLGHGTMTGLLGGALHFEPALAAAVGATTLPYTKTGISAINRFAARTPGTSGPMLTQTGATATGVNALTDDGYSPRQVQRLEGSQRHPGRPAKSGATIDPFEAVAE